MTINRRSSSAFGRVLLLTTAASLTLVVNWARAEQRSAPSASVQEFEVASVKATKSPGGVNGGCRGSDARLASNDSRSAVPIGRCVITSGALSHLMAIAYQIDVNRIVGGPDWSRSDRFDVEAKAESPIATQEQLLQMLQKLLADRFKVAMRSETRELSGYALVIAKSGIKLKEASDSEESRLAVNSGKGSKSTAVDGQPVNLNGISATKVSIDQFAAVLSRGAAGGPVVDKTGLKAHYDLKLSWETGESLSRALEEQLGLKLEAQKVPVQFITIESAQKPTGN
jgi:uncharacterized protein (TIGR03435 family)